MLANTINLKIGAHIFIESSFKKGLKLLSVQDLTHFILDRIEILYKMGQNLLGHAVQWCASAE